ncbi:MAG: hypothetical protein M3142_06470 [Bacteroidota bacterium]|nr:hypothetical protein [Bacteroidota bacterium]
MFQLMLDQKEFNLLSEKEKITYLRRGAVYLATREKKEFIIKLYYLNTFFVEVYYDVYQRQYNYFGTFCNTIWLEPYLRIIKLNL